ncbi:MAG: hypothetical protein AAGG48_28895 [Planctomycetota bacterium]
MTTERNATIGGAIGDDVVYRLSLAITIAIEILDISCTTAKRFNSKARGRAAHPEL